MASLSAIIRNMQTSLIFALLPLAALHSPAQVADISMEEAVGRLISYGLIHERPESERDDSDEILHHFAKLKNEDEEIHEFPYCLRLIQLGTTANKVPVSCVRPFVTAGATVQGSGGDTSPLQAAAELGDVKMIAYLLNAGADLHYQDAGHLMALDYAIENRAAAAVRLLLERGAVATPLSMERAAGGDSGILKQLLEHGGVITAETLAAAASAPENLETLLQSGGDINSRCRDGRTVARAFLQRADLHFLNAEDLARTLDILEQFGADFYVPAAERPVPRSFPASFPPELRERLTRLYSQPEPKPLPPAEAEEAEEVEDE